MRHFIGACVAVGLAALSLTTPAGAAELEYVALNSKGLKQVLIKKNWVFSKPQIATVETLALLAPQRYHLTAYKAV